MKIFLTTTLALGALCILDTGNSAKAALTKTIAPVISENPMLLARGGGRGGGRMEGHREGNMGERRNLNDYGGGDYGGGFVGDGCVDSSGNPIPCSN